MKVYRLPGKPGLSTQKVTVLATVSITDSYELDSSFARCNQRNLRDNCKPFFDKWLAIVDESYKWH